MRHLSRRPGRLSVATIVLASILAIAMPAQGATVVTISTDAGALAAAVAADQSWITGAEIETSPPGGTTTGIVSGPVAG